jgi:hypothetical protein
VFPERKNDEWGIIESTTKGGDNGREGGYI